MNVIGKYLIYMAIKCSFEVFKSCHSAEHFSIPWCKHPNYGQENIVHYAEVEFVRNRQGNLLGIHGDWDKKNRIVDQTENYNIYLEILNRWANFKIKDNFLEKGRWWEMWYTYLAISARTYKFPDCGMSTTN